jgi:hypothetical protein
VTMKHWNRFLRALAVSGLVASPACTQIAGIDGTYEAAIDAPCQSNSDCGSGVCNIAAGWCTEVCMQDADCPSCFCIENTNYVYACFPSCAASDNCSAFGSGFTCTPAATVDGVAASICTK